MNGRSGPRLVVFDWDGTLSDSAARIVDACSAAMADCGLSPPEPARVRELIGLELGATFSRLVPGAGRQRIGELVARYREHASGAAARASDLFPGSRETLDTLAAAGSLLAVATGMGRRGLDREIAAHGLAAHFAATRCADEAPSKPHPGMLLEILEELDVAPHDALMVGDTEYDLQMARSAEVRAVAVRCGVHDERRLLESRPFAVIDDVRQLPAWCIEQWSPARR